MVTNSSKKHLNNSKLLYNKNVIGKNEYLREKFLNIKNATLSKN